MRTLRALAAGALIAVAVAASACGSSPNDTVSGSSGIAPGGAGGGTPGPGQANPPGGAFAPSGTSGDSGSATAPAGARNTPLPGNTTSR
jgi:hypothetical protein